MKNKNSLPNRVKDITGVKQRGFDYECYMSACYAESLGLRNVLVQDKNGSSITTYSFTSLVDGVPFPERLRYPLTYKNINLANYQEALKNMGMGSTDVMNKKLIFAKR